MGMTYNDPYNGSPSSIGEEQFRDFFWKKKALIELQKEKFFSQQADVTGMPKNVGKRIKQYLYLPLLDDRNINDQGIDANGAITSQEVTIEMYPPDASGKSFGDADYAANMKALYFVGNHATVEATAALAAQSEVLDWAQAKLGTVYAALPAGSDSVRYAALILTGGGASSAFDLGYRFVTKATVNGAGNLYGSSKDVGTISGKMPVVSENGGRVNRVGFRRIELEGLIEQYGFFDEYNKQSMMFDSDTELRMHINREMLRGAHEITEDLIQIDLLNGAGVIRYAGTAITNSQISGEDGDVCEVTYQDLMKLSIDLDNNRTPKKTTIITGSGLTDTKVIPAARVMYIGSELIPTIEKMTNHFGKEAFIPLAHYAAAGSELNGEIGTVGHFRICVVPEMMHWAGAGATQTDANNQGYRVTNDRYDVYPMLVIGDKSFTTIGFQTNGKSFKFEIIHKPPGKENATYTNDPYGQTGFMSILWWYGLMILRSERIALIKTVAQW